MLEEGSTGSAGTRASSASSQGRERASDLRKDLRRRAAFTLTPAAWQLLEAHRPAVACAKILDGECEGSADAQHFKVGSKWLCDACYKKEMMSPVQRRPRFGAARGARPKSDLRFSVNYFHACHGR